MTNLRDRAVSLLRDEPLMILPRSLERLLDGLDAPLAAHGRNSMPTRETGTGGRTAVLPIHGFIAQDRELTAVFGGTNIDDFSRQFDQAMSSDSVSNILLDIRSSGGTVLGVPELADKIFAARRHKSIFAQANS